MQQNNNEEKSHLYSFGQNSYGELGLNCDMENQCTPTSVAFCRGKRVKMVCAGTALMSRDKTTTMTTTT